MPQEPDGYQSYEDEWLPKLRDAALAGMHNLQAAFKSVPASAAKNQLWAKHKESLKSEAEKVVDAEVAQ